MSAEARIIELNLEFPPAPKPGGIYHPVVIVGNLAHVSGHGPMRTDGSMITGKVGATMNESDGYTASRQPSARRVGEESGETGFPAMVRIRPVNSQTPETGEFCKIFAIERKRGTQGSLSGR